MPHKEEIDRLWSKLRRLYAELKTENDALSGLEGDRKVKPLTPTQEQLAQLARDKKIEIEKEIQVVEVNLAQLRLTDLVAELEPNAVVEWDNTKVPTWVRMRVHHPSTGAVVIPSSGDVHVSEIVDKTDDQIRQLLKAWSGGKL